MKPIYIYIYYIYIYIYNLRVFWETGWFQGKKCRGTQLRLSQLATFTIFSPRNNLLSDLSFNLVGSVTTTHLHFKHSTLFRAGVIFGFTVRSCKIFVQLSTLFRKISPPLKHFATLKSHNTLIFESSWLSIVRIFCLKVTERFFWLSWNPLLLTFPLTYLKAIS